MRNHRKTWFFGLKSWTHPSVHPSTHQYKPLKWLHVKSYHETFMLCLRRAALPLVTIITLLSGFRLSLSLWFHFPDILLNPKNLENALNFWMRTPGAKWSQILEVMFFEISVAKFLFWPQMCFQTANFILN